MPESRIKEKKVAIVLLNMGGPDCPESVKPFLFNLFNDPAIIPLPGLIRWFLAWFISTRRASVARDIYDKIGGSSPLLELTKNQAAALEEELKGEVKVFIAMRYWHPTSKETVDEIRIFSPDEVILLPLYPQYSKTTSGSSIAAWKQAAATKGLNVPTYAVCCYPSQPGLITEHVKHICAALNEAKEGGHSRLPRILFSAHGLPKTNIEKGDPYAWQVERTAKAIIAEIDIKNLDWTICYQSRVGPQEWIKPYIKDELERAANDKVAVVVVPIAFVSEHSETLVELDIQYRELADKLGVPGFFRTPTVGTGNDFIKGLANMVRAARRKKMDYYSQSGERQCPALCRHCPNVGSIMAKD